MIKSIIIFILVFIQSGLSLATIQTKTLIELESELYLIENKKTEIYSTINTIQNNIESLTDGLNQRKKRLSHRLFVLSQIRNYKMGGLLQNGKMNELQRHLNNLNKINQYDLGLIQEQIYKLDELKYEKNRLTKVKNDFEKLSSDLKSQEKLVHQKEQSENEQFIRKSSSSLLLTKGNLAKPVLLKIKEAYGFIKYNNKQTEQQYMLFNKGYTFSAEEKPSTVQAVANGKIVYHGHLKNRGESVIIEHDGGYYSVYNQVASCIIHIDQKVLLAEKICETNQSDFYFELRHLKITINPKKWIKDLS